LLLPCHTHHVVTNLMPQKHLGTCSSEQHT
jgi:hypothetical protein